MTSGSGRGRGFSQRKPGWTEGGFGTHKGAELRERGVRERRSPVGLFFVLYVFCLGLCRCIEALCGAWH